MELDQTYNETTLPDNHEEERLLVEEAKTDDQAFEKLYHNYFPKIYGYVYKRTGGNQHTTEDIVSTVFLKVCTKLSLYNYQQCSFGAWLYKIAGNCLIDYYRHAARHPVQVIDDIPEIVDNSQNQITSLIKADEGKKVREAITKLPSKYQEIIELKYFAELSNQEIAKTLGLTANNVGVLLHRALNKFEKQYTDYV